MKRRRFLSIAAAALVSPQRVRAETVWRGLALGAATEIRLYGAADRATKALEGVGALLEQVETSFSLYRASELTRLNANGRLRPSDLFSQLMSLSADLNANTDGAFDPTIQSLWAALAKGALSAGPIGWHHLKIDKDIVLAPGQALTFNGIAQGFATDLVRDHLAQHGFARALINIGEYSALGGPFRLGVEDPEAGLLAQWQIRNGALAVSSAQATLVGGKPHILHPKGWPALWSTVAVHADRAVIADGLSTALTFLTRDRITEVKASLPGIARVGLVDFQGNLETV